MRVSPNPAEDGNDEEEPTGLKTHGGFAASKREGQHRANGRTAQAKHLFAAWGDVISRLRDAKRLALLLDFDGTLVNLRLRPGQVRLRKPMRRILARLVNHPCVVVFIVSGRALADIRRKVAVRGIRYLGLYGWERDGAVAAANLRTRHSIQKAKTVVARSIRGLPGIWIEDKGMSLAIHFRGARRPIISKPHRAVLRDLRSFKPGLRVLSGKSWEILPTMIRGKGAAVSTLLARLPESTLPIYAGDDIADESAFQALHRGITVRVGKSMRTRARFRLRNPEEVLLFLKELERQLPCGRPGGQATQHR